LETKPQSSSKMNKSKNEPEPSNGDAQPMMPFQHLKDNTYYPPNKTTIKFINEEVGLGVFSTKNIKQGERIERCPLIQLDWRRKYHGDPQLHRYVYTNGGCQCRDCAVNGPHMYIAAGYGMLYNHHDSPNTKWVFNFQKLYGDVIAVKAIEKGKQIFVYYGDKYFTSRKKIVLDE